MSRGYRVGTTRTVLLPPQISERAGHTGGVAPYALEPENAARLWRISEELTHS